MARFAWSPGIANARVEAYNRRRRARSVVYENVVKKRGANVAEKIDSLHQAYPWLEGGVLTSLAQGGHGARSDLTKQLAHGALPQFLRRGGTTPGSPVVQDLVQDYAQDVRERKRAHRLATADQRQANEFVQSFGQGGIDAGDVLDVTPVVGSVKKFVETGDLGAAALNAVPGYAASKKVIGGVPEVGIPSVKAIDTVAKNVTRPAFAAANFGIEYIQAGVRQKVGAIQRAWNGDASVLDALMLADPSGIYGQVRDYTGQSEGPSRVEQTTLGQAGKALLEGEEVDMGGGFLPDPHSPIGKKQAKAARASASIDGHGATLGRFYASLLLDPDSTEADILSGFVDAAVMMSAVDPANAVLGGVGRANKARKTFGTSTAVEEGLVRETWRKTILHPNPQEWLATAPDAQLLKTAIKGESSPAKIWRRMIQTNKDFPVVSAYGDNIFEDLSRADTDEAVDGVLKRVLGITYKDVPKAPGLGYKFRKVTADVTLFGQAPARTSDPTDLQDFVRGVEDNLLNARVKVGKRDEILDQVFHSASNTELGAKIDRFQAADLAGQAIEASLVSSGISPERASELSRLFRTQLKETHSIFARPIAEGEQMQIPGFLHADTGELVDFTEHPLTLAHGLASKIEWPDYREVRRATSFFSPIFDNPVMISHGAKWPGLTAITDSYMQKWKLAILSKPNLMLRVVGEEQLRMAGASDGLVSLANHPSSALALALGGSPEHPWMANALRKGGVFTEKMAEGLAKKKGVDLDLLRTSAQENAVRIAGESGGDIDKIAKGLYREKVANSVVSGLGTYVADAQGHPLDPTGWEPGLAAHYQEALYSNWADYRPDLRKYAVGDWRHLPKTEEKWSEGLITELSQAREPVTRATVEMGPAAAKEAFWSGKLKHWRVELAKRPELRVLGDSNQASDDYIDVLYQQVDEITKGDPRLVDAIRTGKFEDIPLTDRWGRADATAIKKFDALKDTDPTFGPDLVKHQKMLNVSGKEDNGLNRFFDSMFFHLMPQESNYLSRSTSFRQYLWKHNEELMPYLKTEARGELIENARTAKISDEAVEALERIAKSTPEPEERLALDLVQLDHAAKSMALDDTRKLLYDLSEKGQFSDVFRNIFPFMEAWKEVLGRWGNIIKDNPSVIRTAQKTLAGAKNSGVFHQNEFGQEVFSIPGTEWLTETLPGINTPVPLDASSQGLSLATTGLPGLGPVPQIFASYLIPDDPKWDGLMRQMFPFGDILKTGNPPIDIALAAAPIPNWFRRVLIGLKDPDKFRDQGNVAGHIMRYKSSTGDYDLRSSNPERRADEQRRLVEDSKESAMWFTFLRAGVLATSPSAPIPKWSVEDKDGQLVAAHVLIKDFRKTLESVDGNYDRAVKQWLGEHGEDNFLLLQAFSEPVEGFLPATGKASKWARSNPKIREKHPEIYGFFAPAGGEYDQAVFGNIFDRGERVALTPRQMLKAGNSRVASNKYQRAVKTSDGSDEDKAWLREYRTALRGDYPGFDETGYDYRRVPVLSDQIAAAVKDPQVAKTDAGQAAKSYLHEYNFYIKAASDAGYQTLNNNWARENEIPQYLRKYGQALVKDHPDFLPMWQYVFSVQLGGS